MLAYMLAFWTLFLSHLKTEEEEFLVGGGGGGQAAELRSFTEGMTFEIRLMHRSMEGNILYYG